MLIVTLGDPFGVTIELLAKLLAEVSESVNGPTVVIGSWWQWRHQLDRLGIPPLPFRQVATLDGPIAKGLYFLAVDADGAGAAPTETLAPRVRGLLAVRALEAIRSCPKGRRIAVVTGPIDKNAAHLAGLGQPGQTEWFESLWGQPAIMILAGSRLRVGLVTNHLPLAAVAGAVSASLVEAKAHLFVNSLREHFGIAQPRIAVAALNPHAGDGGLIGDEDDRLITPALDRVRARLGADAVCGPVPADTAFYRAFSGAYDGVLALYHDQGLGPLKTVHFDEAVNVSGGLPHLRVSPDHGPARDLFLKGQASPQSFANALAMAARFLGRRET